jgi:hypothetical protein
MELLTTLFNPSGVAKHHPTSWPRVLPVLRPSVPGVTHIQPLPGLGNWITAKRKVAQRVLLLSLFTSYFLLPYCQIELQTVGGQM